MKKRILLLTAVAGMCYVVFTSESGGPAYYGASGGGNRTGAKASVTNCGGSNGAVSCHGTGTSTTVTITIDSGSTTTATTHYKPGLSYTIKIHGNNTALNPDFGFEFAAVSGTGATQVQAGTFSGLATSVSNDSYLGLNFIEHNHVLVGSPAGTYDQSFTWTAPSTSVGNITLYCTLNAVNGNAVADAGDISGNTSVILTPINTTETASIIENISIKAFPNPVTNNLNLQLDNAQPGTYSLQVFNLNGSAFLNQTIEVNSVSQATGINTSDWAPGLYSVVVEKDGSRKTTMVVKQ